MANLLLKGKSRSKNTRIPKNMDGDASKQNWRDREVQEDIEKRKLFELFDGNYIEPSEVDKINFLLDKFHEPTFERSVILTGYIKIAELKSASGIILKSEGDFDGQFAGKHGSELPEQKHPSKIAVVLSVGPDVNSDLKRGDIVRFWPLSAMEIKFNIYHVVQINESHLQTLAGHYGETPTTNKKGKYSFP